MASIETVVQNADAEMNEDAKPDSTAEGRDDSGKFHNTAIMLVCHNDSLKWLKILMFLHSTISLVKTVLSLSLIFFLM